MPCRVHRQGSCGPCPAPVLHCCPCFLKKCKYLLVATSPQTPPLSFCCYSPTRPLPFTPHMPPPSALVPYLSDLVTPVSTTHGNDAHLGQDDGTTDSSGNLHTSSRCRTVDTPRYTSTKLQRLLPGQPHQPPGPAQAS